MRDILHIEGLVLDEGRTRETEDKVIVGVKRRFDGLETCPHCGGNILAPNGTRTVRLKDMPIPTILGVIFAGAYLFGEVGLYLAACSILAGLCYAMDKRSKRKAQP